MRGRHVKPLVGLEAAAAAGATGIGGIALHLRGEVKQIFFDCYAPTARISSSAARPLSVSACHVRGHLPTWLLRIVM